MINRSAPDWISAMSDSPDRLRFPGYADHPDYPFFYQQTLTHADFDDEEFIGNFSLGDNPADYTKNLALKGPDWHYASKKVTYHTNSNGYRAPDWNTIDWAESIVILGCSMTYGTGVAEDETLGYFLSEISGRPVVNLGYPAGSNDLILYNMGILREKFPAPHAVVANWSTLDRFMFFSHHLATIGLWTDDRARIDDVKLQRMYKDRRYNETNMNMHGYYQAKVAKTIWSGISKYASMSYYKSTAHFTKSRYVEADASARDLVHPGANTHKTAAQILHEMISEQ